MLREMADLGFTHAELSHGIRLSLVPGIMKAYEDGVIKISSIHNFCPLPAGVLQAAPNLYEPSSLDPRERDQWLRHTKRTIDFAGQLKARAVVCHLGSVVFFWFNPVRKLQRYLAEHPGAVSRGDEQYKALIAKAMNKLRKRMGPFWDNTRTSLGKVLDYAAEKGVMLALENREKFEELPVDADFPEFLAGLPAGAAAGYWHDTGHAQIKHNLGLLDHRQQLEKNASRLLGFHLHDVNAEGEDHQAIGSGTIDFGMVSSFWQPNQLLTLEIGPQATVEEVQDSKIRIDQLINGLNW
jgi:sugar phosphate isomerase/epimerase